MFRVERSPYSENLMGKWRRLVSGWLKLFTTVSKHLAASTDSYINLASGRAPTRPRALSSRPKLSFFLEDIVRNAVA